MSIQYLNSFKVVFWDFDGVIKDSVGVKSDAFEQLFLPFGVEVAREVRKHHDANSGISRFDKLALYLDLAEQNQSSELINKYLKLFSDLVKQKVIDSEWVYGVTEYLQNNSNIQQFFLVTATPQEEIEYIVNKLKIGRYFMEIIGSPANKKDAISSLLLKYSIIPERAVMIGDSHSDYDASIANNISFIIRGTNLNKKLQSSLDCQVINDFYD